MLSQLSFPLLIFLPGRPPFPQAFICRLCHCVFSFFFFAVLAAPCLSAEVFDVVFHNPLLLLFSHFSFLCLPLPLPPPLLSSSSSPRAVPVGRQVSLRWDLQTRISRPQRPCRRPTELPSPAPAPHCFPLLHWPDRRTESVGATGRWRFGDAAMGWAQFISCDELRSSPSCAPATPSALISTSQSFMAGRYHRCAILLSIPPH